MPVPPKYSWLNGPILLTSLLLTPLCLWGDTGNLYSIHGTNREIRRAAIEAAAAQTLVGPGNLPSFTSARSFALDTLNQKVYWTQADPNLIARANLSDGSNYEFLSLLPASPGAIALDPAHDQLFFALPLSGIIARAKLNGTEQVGIIGKQGSPNHLALDIPNQHVYWTDPALRKIRRANFDGSNIIEVVNIGINEQPTGLSLDLTNNKIYWTDFAFGNIKVASLANLPANGAAILDGLAFPSEVALDLGAQIPKLYYLSRAAGADQYFAYYTALSKPVRDQGVISIEPRLAIALDLPCTLFSLDSDGDAVPDCQDGCLADPNKISPATCGCGAAETDTDKDSIPDCIDACPNTPSVILPGTPPFCPSGPVLSPSTVLNDPPLIRVRGRNVTVFLQSFAAVTDNISVNQAARRLAVKYDVRLKSKNVLTSQLHAKTVKRNKLVYRNLAPGSYSVRYRALIGRGKRTVSRTKFSPPAKFLIP